MGYPSLSLSPPPSPPPIFPELTEITESHALQNQLKASEFTELPLGLVPSLQDGFSPFSSDSDSESISPFFQPPPLASCPSVEATSIAAVKVVRRVVGTVVGTVVTKEEEAPVKKVYTESFTTAKNPKILAIAERWFALKEPPRLKKKVDADALDYEFSKKEKENIRCLLPGDIPTDKKVLRAVLLMDFGLKMKEKDFPSICAKLGLEAGKHRRTDYLRSAQILEVRKFFKNGKTPPSNRELAKHIFTHYQVWLDETKEFITKRKRLKLPPGELTTWDLRQRPVSSYSYA